MSLVPSWLNSAKVACFAFKPDVTPRLPAQDDCVDFTHDANHERGEKLARVLRRGWLADPCSFGRISVLCAARGDRFVVAFLLGLAAWSASALSGSGRALLALGVAITPMTLFLGG